MANFKIIPYRDREGYLIKDKRAIFTTEKHLVRTSGGYVMADLIWCPEKGLRWIGHCEKCELFAGHEKYIGVRCRSQKKTNNN